VQETLVSDGERARESNNNRELRLMVRVVERRESRDRADLSSGLGERRRSSGGEIITHRVTIAKENDLTLQHARHTVN
jgi:hypothetical protein